MIAMMMLRFSFLPALFVLSHARELETLEEVCTDLAERYTKGEDGAYVCDCTGELNDFTAFCTNDHPTCWFRAPSFSTVQYTVDFSFSEQWINNSETVNYEECLHHHSTCNTVCVGLTDTEGDYASINGKKCNSVTPCSGEGSGEEESIYDCSNVIPGTLVDMCTGEGLEGSPFEPWALTVASSALASTSTFEPGQCDADSAVPRGLEESKCKGSSNGSSNGSSAVLASGSTAFCLLPVATLLFGLAL
jgi:hypothetical protein